jgi:uncharacterized membrane protein YgcG
VVARHVRHFITLAVPWLAACGVGQPPRVVDRAGVLDRAELPQFESYLDNLEKESGVDIRFLFVDSVAGPIEAFAVREARALGIGQDLDRRGVLFVYDTRRERLRIEVGPTLQGIFTDRLVGYLMRDHVSSFFAAGEPTLGLRLTMFMLHSRLRRARLGEEYNPAAADFIAERRRLATGGGATGTMATARARPLLGDSATDDLRRGFGPQATVEGTYRRYLEWLRRTLFVTNAEFLTPASRNYLAGLPMSAAFRDYILFLEYGRRYTILERGDLALLVFTDDPLVSPHFFRRTASGWQMDLFTEVRNTHEYIGSPWTWSMILQEDDFTHAFIDRYVRLGGLLRLADGDNRPIPMATGEQPPVPAATPLIERLTVAQASQRIAERRGKPVVVLLYSTWSKNMVRLMPALMEFLRRCEAAGIEVLAFSSDDNSTAILRLSDLLLEHQAPFPPLLLYDWAPGELSRAMAPHGIVVEPVWRPPLIALVGADGRAIAQDEGIVSRGEELAIDNVAAAVRRLSGR